jgi:hypothetical protein
VGTTRPGGPTETPKSETFPVSTSYTQPWINTSVIGVPVVCLVITGGNRGEDPSSEASDADALPFVVTTFA